MWVFNFHMLNSAKIDNYCSKSTIQRGIMLNEFIEIEINGK